MQLAVTIILVHLISYLFFIFYQTEALRPQIIGAGLFNDLVRFIYAHDAPYNCFPSLHTSLSTVMALYFVFIKSKWKLFFVIISLLIILSTLFVKQHYILDVIAGLILGVGATLLIFKRISNITS
jgi:membrane-associated phospholipid phosphatase